MKTEVKRLEDNKRQISIEVSRDVVKAKFEDIFKRIAKEAKIPGFRQGHAPQDLLEKHYAKNAHEQVLKELIPDVYNQALGETGLDVIELPEITEVKLDRQSLSFKATVEISPEINIKDYKGQKINYKKITVSPDEIKRQTDSIKESRKLESMDDGLANSLGYPNLQELENALERQIFLQKEGQQRTKIENEIVENIIKGLNFKLPQALVNRQLKNLVRQTKVDLALKGLPRQDIDAKEQELSKRLEPEARKQVEVYLVLQAIAKKENIPLDDNMPRRVMELLLKEGEWNLND